MVIFNVSVALALIFLVPFLEAAGPAWITLCTESGIRKIHAGGCPRGIVLNTPITVTSACVNGVWILATSLCDTRPLILVGAGNEHCFSLNMQVNKVTFVGRPGDPFAEGHYIGPSYLSVFWRLDLGQRSDNVEFPGGHSLLSINFDNVIEVVTSEGVACCPLTPSLVQLCLGETEEGQYFRVASTCSDSSLRAFGLNPGEGFRLDQGKSGVLKFYADTSPSSIITTIEFETDCCSCLDFEDRDLTYEQKRINEQTGRVATKYLHWSLGKKQYPKVEHSEYPYVQLARKIVSHVCPKEDFPDHFSIAMLTFHRLLLLETMKNSPMVENFDEKRHQKILESLESCLHQAKTCSPIRINWDSENTCPEKVLNVTRGSKSYPMDDLEETLSYEELDIPLEVIWKIMTFTHYFCAKEFRSHPVDHSALMVSFESLYNTELLQRWANPGKSYEVMQLLFPAVNLQRALTALAACVKFAQATSDYKKWIERPVLTPLGPRVHNPSTGWIWNNSALCLNSYWEAKMEESGSRESRCFPPYNKFYQS